MQENDERWRSQEGGPTTINASRTRYQHQVFIDAGDLGAGYLFFLPHLPRSPSPLSSALHSTSLFVSISLFIGCQVFVLRWCGRGGSDLMEGFDEAEI